MMITLHGDRGKRKAKTKAQDLHVRVTSPILAAASSFRCLGETVWVRGFFAVDFVACVHVRCTCACRKTCAYIAGHGPYGMLELFIHVAGVRPPIHGAGAAKQGKSQERARIGGDRRRRRSPGRPHHGYRSHHISAGCGGVDSTGRWSRRITLGEGKEGP